MNIVFDIFFSIFNFIFWSLFIIFFPFIFMIIFYHFYFFVKGYRKKKGSVVRLKKRGIIKRLFIDFPKQFILDMYEKNPDYFPDYGVHIFAGEQGSGKTIAMTYLLNKYQKMYPKLVVKTNYNYVGEDAVINHWNDIVHSENGIYGEIDCIDEIQNWFSSLQSKNFPVQMLEEITQQRKQKKCIFGTSQVWSRVGKPLREQTTFLYEPFTIFGCITVVRVYKPVVKADGLTDSKKLRKMFFFVHTKNLRESYDTYKKIELLSKEGFTDVNPCYENAID